MKSLLFGSRSLVWASLLCSWSVGVSAQDTAAPTETPGDVVTSPPTATGWQGCYDYTTGKQKVTIGKPTTICLHIADGADWSLQRQYMRVNFAPIADQYSRFLVPNSFKELVLDQDITPESSMPAVAQIYLGKNITVHVASQTTLSFQKRYFDGFEKVYPFLTAIIDVDEGVVQGIAWDDASIFCGNNEADLNTFDFAGIACSESRCGQPVDGCYFSPKQCVESGATCDLLLYVVWTGTDSAGKSFMSSSYRYSAFPPQEWADRLTQNLPSFEMPDLNPLDNNAEEGG